MYNQNFDRSVISKSSLLGYEPRHTSFNRFLLNDRHEAPKTSCLRSAPSETLLNKTKKSLKSSKRINLLSKQKYPVEGKQDFVDVQPKPVRYRAMTPRLLELAAPKVYLQNNIFFNKKSIVDRPSFSQVSSLKSLDRIKELASPKRSVDLIKKNPFGVNPRALKATCSSRVEELAQPKHLHRTFLKSIEGYLNRVYKSEA